MDHPEMQFDDLEPMNSFGDAADVLEDANFNPEFVADLYSFSDLPPLEAYSDEQPNTEIPQYHGLEEYPPAPEPHGSHQEYIDPRLLDKTNNITDATLEQQPNIKYTANNRGSIADAYPSMPDMPGPPGMPGLPGPPVPPGGPVQYVQYPVQYTTAHPGPYPVQYLNQPPIQYSNEYSVQYSPTQYTFPHPVQQTTQHPVQHPGQHPVQSPVQYPGQYPLYPPQYPPQYSPQYSPQHPPQLPPQHAPEQYYPPPQASTAYPPGPKPDPDSDLRRVSEASSTFINISADPNSLPDQQSRLPSPILIETGPRPRRPDKGPNGESLKNGRIPRVTRKDQPKPDAREYYGPPPPRPQSWGPPDRHDRPLFKYTEFGELEKGKMYSKQEVRKYMFGPKKNDNFTLPPKIPGVPEVQGKVRQGLTIWISWVPPQSNDRYPRGPNSQRCRFEDCKDPHNTIRSGFPRVTFDERMNMDGEYVDPYYNAGYAHLYCFEQHFDMVGALLALDVRPDDRNYKREENLGKLSRQHPEIRSEIDDWFRIEYPKWLQGMRTGNKRKFDYKYSLSERLVGHMLANSSETRVKLREKRGGADISKHRGDLAVWLFLKECQHYGLLDDDGEPFPGAEADLERFKMKKGKSRAKALKRARLANIRIPPGQQFIQGSPGDPNYQNQGYEPFPYTSHLTYMSPGAATVGSYQFGFENRPTTSHLPHQPAQEPPPASSGRKRDVSEMLAEDQNAGHNGTQEPIESEGGPAKRQRQELPTPGSMPGGANNQTHETVEDNVQLPDSDQHVKVEDVSNTNSIAELPTGKSDSGGDVDQIVQPVNPKGKSPSPQRRSPTRSLEDIELGSDEDVFGDNS
ncbi:hypothetical protein GGR54DRAFT_470309 [Hypoxylon sp. NC1633]|nr:hypothetical protein GGR54DRAFT_470309 [Hypoxylon sp. NC1633]